MENIKMVEETRGQEKAICIYCNIEIPQGEWLEHMSSAEHRQKVRIVFKLEYIFNQIALKILKEDKENDKDDNHG